MPDFKAMIKDFDEKEAQRPAEAQKWKENDNKSELADTQNHPKANKKSLLAGSGRPWDEAKQAPQPKQGTFKQAINDISKADEGTTKVPTRGFEIGPDGTYVPKEYSDSDMREAYDAAMEHIKKGGNVMEFRDQHPEYNADAIMAAFGDYSKSPNKENGEVDVPYHEGIKGRIVDRKDGVVTVEYTTKNGITRRDQFHEDEFKSDVDKSLETTDNRGEGANPNFNREKFGKYFNPDGTLKKGMEDQYFAATRGQDDSGLNGNENAPEDDFAKSKSQIADFIDKAARAYRRIDKRNFQGTVGIPEGIKRSLMKDYGMNEEEADQAADAYWNSPGWVKKAVKSNTYAQDQLKDWLGNRKNDNATENDYGGLDEEHNRLYEEFMSIDKAYRDADAKLNEQVRQGQIGTDQWDKFWEEKDKLYDYYTDLKRKKKAEMDSVYAKIKAIDDERERKIQEAKKKKEADALTAKRNQVRSELERRIGRRYSDDEWAAIVELASQIR